jgi:hypothetical protein
MTLLKESNEIIRFWIIVWSYWMELVGCSVVLAHAHSPCVPVSTATAHRSSRYTAAPSFTVSLSHVMDHASVVDQPGDAVGSGWISGSVVEGAPTEEPRRDASNKQREETTTRHKGNWRVPCFCLCVKHPWLPTGVLHCPGHPSCAGA